MYASRDCRAEKVSLTMLPWMIAGAELSIGEALIKGPRVITRKVRRMCKGLYENFILKSVVGVWNFGFERCEGEPEFDLRASDIKSRSG